MQAYHDCSALFQLPYRGENSAPSRLVVFAHAGGFAQQWQQICLPLTAHCEVLLVEYPGHGVRSATALADSMTELAVDLGDQLGRYWHPNTILLGYSMGALCAYLVEQQLRKQNKAVRQLILAAYPAPWLEQFQFDFDTSEQDAQLSYLSQFDSAAHAVFSSEQLSESYLPVMQHDFQLLQRCSLAQWPEISCPVTLLAGKFDRAVALQDVMAWREICEHEVQAYAIDGEHFFVHQSRARFLAIVQSKLNSDSERISLQQE
ncbi:thioesterase II family protein [Pseudoalteromonas rubra]|uniref:thioesterase II family protein n=1 Tax=Pseudoalteromonas rubra TaxID=43658 RepID=UPI0013DD8A87|nr:alpha/beta fold hydrolase [Pseudoalteromonas rubra]